MPAKLIFFETAKVGEYDLSALSLFREFFQLTQVLFTYLTLWEASAKLNGYEQSVFLFLIVISETWFEVKIKNLLQNLVHLLLCVLCLVILHVDS